MDCVLDFETTGLSSSKGDEIVEATVIDGNGKPLINTLVKPVRTRSWPNAERVHGISPITVRHAPILSEIKQDILNAVKGKRLIIFNKSFDLGFLPELEDYAEETVCCMKEMAKHMNISSGRISLINSAKIAGYEWEKGNQQHRSLEDCLCTLFVWNYIEENRE